MKLSMDDLAFQAITLPDEVKMYHFAGDFPGEIHCIDRWLDRDIPLCLKKKLEIQRLFALQLVNDYPLTREDVLTSLRERYPSADESLLDSFIASGNVDYILKDGQMHFQHQAVSNMFLTHGEELEIHEHPEALRPDTGCTGDHRTMEIMQKNGGRAFRYEVEEWASLTKDAERVGETLRLWFPFPVACATQPGEEIRLLDSSHPVTVTGDVHRTAYMEVPCERDGRYFVRFSFVNRAPYVDLSAHCPTGLPAGDGLTDHDLRYYTSEQYPHIRFTPFIRALGEEIRGDETDPLRIAGRVYDWICHHVRYSYVRDYLIIENIPEFVLANGYGDCGTMALAFITLCRYLGIPAKWQSGSACSPDGIGSHDWAMFHVAPYGWLYCDPSYGVGAAKAGDEVRRRHYFGNLDPFRLVASNEFQQPVVPEKRLCRMDPYDNQNGEAEFADGEHNVFFEEYVHGRRVLSSQELPWLNG